MLSRTLLVLCILKLFLGIFGDGMIEVFKWKQMDFYNRGNNNNNLNNQKPERLPNAPDRVVFPGRAVRDVRSNSKRQQRRERITSRYQPETEINTEFRFGSANDLDTNAEASYIPYNNVPMGANHFKGRLFVTMPRRRLGIPSTLNYIDMRADGTKQSPKLHAYPNFELNQFNNSENGIVSVYRTTVDACQRLWFIDTGMLEYPNNRQQLRQPSIWVLDLKTDRIIKRFEIPANIVTTGSGLASLSVDVKPNNCNKAFAYLPDLTNRQLYVYSFETDNIWAFSHNYFNFDPLGGDLQIGGQTFRWDDGIFSTTLGPILPDGSRNVYFHAMASNNEFFVSNQVLQQESNAARSDHGNDFRVLGSRGENKQSTMHVYDPKTGVIFYDEIHRNGIGCWNTKRGFSAAQHGTVIQDPARMIYPSDLTIDEDGTIWVMSNSMPIFIYSQLDPNEYNFRIWKQNVHEAKRNTICE